MCLGLDVGGLKVKFDKNVCDLAGEQFNSHSITLRDIVNKIKLIIGNNENYVDCVCCLYIFVCFIVFYFSRKYKVVSNMSCTILEDIDGCVIMIEQVLSILFW